MDGLDFCVISSLMLWNMTFVVFFLLETFCCFPSDFGQVSPFYFLIGLIETAFYVHCLHVFITLEIMT
jgi:hypothetical protein